MAAVLLDMDLGERPEEPEALFALAQLACVACGGHAGDDATMARAVALVAAAGNRLAAHPSYPDREGFGRRQWPGEASALQRAVTEQCAALRAHASRAGLALQTVKPHGALYHDANASPLLARAVLAGAAAALGDALVLVGPAGGALEAAAAAHGAGFLREALADRGVRADGTLIPRGEPGALLTDPAAVAASARRLLARGDVDLLCLHGDTPDALELARAVRAALASQAATRPLPVPLGDGALRLERLPGEDAARLLAAARAIPLVTGAVVTERHLCLHFDPGAPPPEPGEALAAALEAASTGPVASTLHRVRVRYDGPDLARVAAHASVRVDEVGALHAARAYTVLVVGFLPGFAYLGEVDPRLAAPRLDSPRPRVPANSVAIAGSRTGIYPFASPGGWNLIGTALDLLPFDPAAGALFALGDRVRFEPAP